MKKLLGLVFILSLLAAVTPAQQTVTVTGSVPYSGSSAYSTTLTINGLPAGCQATLSGTIITISGCPSAPQVAVAATCAASSVQVGKTVQCNALVTNATNQAVTWTSTNTTVATVNATTGLVTGVGVGTTSITAVSQADTTKSSSVSLSGTQATTLITQDATNPLPTSSGSVLVQPTQDPPITGTGTNKVSFTTVGQTYDYKVNVPTAGSYTLSARLCADASVTGGATTVHFEMPAGTRISTPLTLNGAAQWTTVASAQAVSFVAGQNTVRLVIDSLPTGGSSTPGFIHWFQLIPTGTAITHSIKLNWTASVPTDPNSTACQNPVCPWPTGAPPCYAPAITYNLYKSATSGSYAAAFASLSGTSYVDTAVTAGQTWYYKVTGVNPNACTPESVASNEVKAVVPTP